MSFAEILGIVDGLAHVLENMSGFLLEEQNLLLDPRYMYLDLDTQQLCLLYYPFAEKENPTGSIYMPVAEFFLEHVDHKEEKAVSELPGYMGKERRYWAGGCRTGRPCRRGVLRR